MGLVSGLVSAGEAEPKPFAVLRDREGATALAFTYPVEGYPAPVSRDTLQVRLANDGKTARQEPEGVLYLQFNALLNKDRNGLLALYPEGEARDSAEKQFIPYLDSVSAFRQGGSFEMLCRSMVGDYCCLYFNNVIAGKGKRPWFEYLVRRDGQWWLTNGIKNLHLMALVANLRSRYGRSDAPPPTGLDQCRAAWIDFDQSYRPASRVHLSPDGLVAPLRIWLRLRTFVPAINLGAYQTGGPDGDPAIDRLVEVADKYLAYRAKDPAPLNQLWERNEWDMISEQAPYNLLGCYMAEPNHKRDLNVFALIRHAQGTILFVGRRPENVSVLLMQESNGQLKPAVSLIGAQEQVGDLTTVISFDDTVTKAVMAFYGEDVKKAPPRGKP